MTRTMPTQQGAAAPEVLMGEFVAKWANTLRQGQAPAQARGFNGQPRKIDLPSPASTPQGEALKPSPPEAPPPQQPALLPATGARRPSRAATLAGQEPPVSAALERARTVKEPKLAPAIRQSRHVQQAHPQPEAAGPGAPVSGFDPQPSAQLPSGLALPAGRAHALLQEAQGSAVQGQAHAGEVMAQAARHAERARTEARVDVRRCGFLRQAVSRLPGVLLAAFDLACALVVTLATCLYANQVLALALRNFKQAVRGPLAQAGSTATALTAAPGLADPSAQEFRSAAGQPAAGSRGTQRVERLVETLQAARSNMKRAGDEAKTISAAKASFVRRALIGGTGAIGLGVAIAVTVLSGGATLAIPGLVLATVLMRNFVANAQCAWENRKRALAGQPLLPMGTNALNNALHKHYVEERGFTDGQARLEASRVGGSVSVMIGLAQIGSMLSTLLVGSAVVNAAKWVSDSLKGGRLGATIVRANLNAYELSRVRAARDEQQVRRQEATDRSQVAWRQFLDEVHAQSLESRDPDDRPDPRTADQRLDSLSRMLAAWSVNGAKLDDLPEFMSREGWLSGAYDLPEGGVLPGDDAISQAARIQKELHRRQQAGAYTDTALMTTISWSVANWAQTFKLFVQTFVDS